MESAQGFRAVVYISGNGFLRAVSLPGRIDTGEHLPHPLCI